MSFRGREEAAWTRWGILPPTQPALDLGPCPALLLHCKIPHEWGFLHMGPAEALKTW